MNTRILARNEPDPTERLGMPALERPGTHDRLVDPHALPSGETLHALFGRGEIERRRARRGRVPRTSQSGGCGFRRGFGRTSTGLDLKSRLSQPARICIGNCSSPVFIGSIPASGAP